MRIQFLCRNSMQFKLFFFILTVFGPQINQRKLLKQLDLREKVEERRKLAIEKEYRARYRRMKDKGVDKVKV